MTINFRIVRISKGRGLFREIYIASRPDRLELRGLLPELREIHERLDHVGAGYAFLKNRNCALMALQHIGYRYTLSMDLENFFECVTVSHVASVLPPSLIDRCFVGGRLRQGLPTSPAISNIAFIPLDSAIVRALRMLRLVAVYTRYADDLVFSYDDVAAGGKIQTLVRQVVERSGFKVNERKTRIQCADNGRIIVTGIGLDNAGLHATRKTNRKLRAAQHQKKTASVAGLAQWASCKLPKIFLNDSTPEWLVQVSD